MNTKINKGFTLIEVVLGISIFALIALTFYSIFSNGLRINSRAGKNEQLYRELRGSLDTLASDLENMVPYEGYNGDTGVFQGLPQSLSLALPTDSGLKIVHYSLESPDAGKILETRIGEDTSKNKRIVVNSTEEEKIEFLIREETPLFSSTDSNPEKEGEGLEILSMHVVPGSLQFSYAAQGKPTDDEKNLDWKNEWKDAHFPSVVRVELSFVDPDQPETPLLIQKDIFVPTGSWGTSNSSP